MDPQFVQVQRTIRYIGYLGIFIALGILVARRLLPGATATAWAVFISSTAFASALGSIEGGLEAATLKLPDMYLLPALFASHRHRTDI
jgi:SET family sugar efflux transporter-like MFS transporter